MTTPTPEKQVAFLANLQRLLGEGSFVATYKLALLLALSRRPRESHPEAEFPEAEPCTGSRSAASLVRRSGLPLRTPLPPAVADSLREFRLTMKSGLTPGLGCRAARGSEAR